MLASGHPIRRGGIQTIIWNQCGGATNLDALRRYVGDRAKDRPAQVPAGVLAEVPIASGDDVIGGVLLLGGNGTEPAPEGSEHLVGPCRIPDPRPHHGHARSSLGVVPEDALRRQLVRRRRPSGEGAIGSPGSMGLFSWQGAGPRYQHFVAVQP